MSDVTPTVSVDRLDGLDDVNLRYVGDTLLHAYNDALAALQAAESDYSAWRHEMVRRKR